MFQQEPFVIVHNKAKSATLKNSAAFKEVREKFDEHIINAGGSCGGCPTLTCGPSDCVWDGAD